MRRLLFLAVLLTACGVQAGAGQEGSDKVFVCKYVSKPGEDERLQTGDNPISVSVNALVGPGVEVNIGDEFQDAQIRSVVIAFDTGQPEPSPDECPPPNPPPTTTTTTVPTTTTTVVSTTTTTCPDCAPVTNIVTTTTGPTSTTGPTTTTLGSTTTSTGPTTTTTTLPPTFSFAGATTICIVEVPTIRITFADTFPTLAGQTGTLTMSDISGNVVSTQALVYAPGTTVDLLYPGTSVNPDGSVADVPGWLLTEDGFWLRDPSDEFLREGIDLTYTVNPTATARVTYPPASSACANPDGPFPPGVTPPPPGTPATPQTPAPPQSPAPPPAVPDLPVTR